MALIPLGALDLWTERGALISFFLCFLPRLSCAFQIRHDRSCGGLRIFYRTRELCAILGKTDAETNAYRWNMPRYRPSSQIFAFSPAPDLRSFSAFMDIFKMARWRIRRELERSANACPENSLSWTNSARDHLRGLFF